MEISVTTNNKKIKNYSMQRAQKPLKVNESQTEQLITKNVASIH